MNREIERKFLVTCESWRAGVQKSVAISQAYLMSDPQMVIRIRQMENRWILSIKHKVGRITAHEFEYDIPADDGKKLKRAAMFGSVTKIRHSLNFDNHLWYIDEFQENVTGLVMAEIELDNERTVFSKPDWLGAEVSENPNYNNATLALKGLNATI